MKIQRVVRCSMSAELSMAAEAFDGDSIRAVLAEILEVVRWPMASLFGDRRQDRARRSHSLECMTKGSEDHDRRRSSQRSSYRRRHGELREVDPKPRDGE